MTTKVQQLKATYPPGTRLELLHMDDAYAPVPDGTRGTVRFVDDIGQIHMAWDNGRTLAVNTEVDSVRKLTMDEVAEEEIAKGHEVVNLGDDCLIVLPDEPVDCSSLGYFDELEEECWDLVRCYCARLGIKMLPDEDGESPISFDVAKSIQDNILEQLEEAGVELRFDGQDESFTMEM